MTLPIVNDYASIDGNTTHDPVSAKLGGIRGLMPRSGYGRRAYPGDKVIYLDPCAIDMAAIRAAGLRTSSYLFVCVPRRGLVTPEPEVQVDAWLDYVLPLLVRHRDIAPGIDLEEESDVLAHAQLFAWYERAAVRAHERLGCWPNFYTSNRYWHEGLGNPAAGVFAKCPPWIAKPWPWNVNTPMQWGDSPSQPTLIPAFGNNWFLYQRQGDAIGCPGFNRTTDVSLVRQFGKGARGQHVEMVQRWCNASGLLSVKLAVDGDYGDLTVAAVKVVQAGFRIAADGIFGLDSLCAFSWIDLG